MSGILDFIPDFESLLSLEPEELAFPLLRLASSFLPSNQFHPHDLISTALQPDIARHGADAQRLDPATEQAVEVALIEGWHWLEINGLILPALGPNGRNGFKMLSKEGQRVARDSNRFEAFQQAAAFPKRLLHPSIADRVWGFLMRGEFDTAVFHAFRTIEERTREAGGFDKTDIGTDLMRRAFDPASGPLTKLADPKPEREALAHLFAGAIGSYKNPHSHRTVTISDRAEAQEIVVLASHLLRIVDARTAS